MSDLKQTIYLRQSSSFGPWVECEKSHPDAVAFDRRTQPEATAPAAPAILPTGWAAKHYTGDEWPTVKSSGIELECAGADREQAEAIAAILNNATAAAQDLSAAIPNWSGIADRLNELDKAIAHSTNLTPQSKPRRLLYAILHEVCSSPANALSAGDRVDAVPEQVVIGGRRVGRNYAAKLVRDAEIYRYMRDHMIWVITAPAPEGEWKMCCSSATDGPPELDSFILQSQKGGNNG